MDSDLKSSDIKTIIPHGRAAARTPRVKVAFIMAVIIHWTRLYTFKRHKTYYYKDVDKVPYSGFFLRGKILMN